MRKTVTKISLNNRVQLFVTITVMFFIASFVSASARNNINSFKYVPNTVDAFWEPNDCTREDPELVSENVTDITGFCYKKKNGKWFVYVDGKEVRAAFKPVGQQNIKKYWSVGSVR